MKKIGILFVMILMMMLFAVSANALDTKGQCGDDAFWSYNSETKELVISGTGATRNYKYKTSPFYDGDFETLIIKDGVTTIGDYMFYYNPNLKKIIIPNSITNIGDNALGYCMGLTDITIPYGVKSIGSAALYCCSKLTSLIIPDSVTSIGFEAFRGCQSLTNITLPLIGASKDEEINVHFGYVFGAESEEKNNYYTPVTLKTVTISDACEKIGFRAFLNCENITNIVLPDTSILIGGEAFYGTAYYKDLSNWENRVLYIGNHLIRATDAITSCNVRPGTKTIASEAFYWCTEITSITLPDGLLSIGSSAFNACKSLENINIPDSVIVIGSGAFSQCMKLTEITIPHGIKSINTGTFYVCANLKSITIPDSVTTIGKRAFQACKALTSVIIPDSVMSIDEAAFNECEILKSITVGNGVTSIGKDAFSECIKLESIKLGNSVKSIGYEAFRDCESLKNIIIPDSVTLIGQRAFLNCLSLTNITLGNRVETIYYDAFSGCKSLTSITIPASLMSIKGEAFLNTDLKYVFYGGTEVQRKNIEIDIEGNDKLNFDAVWHYRATDHSYDSYKIAENATCSNEGSKQRGCFVCDYVESVPLAKLEHSYKITTTAATLSNNGEIATKCTLCGDASEKTIIYYPEIFELSESSYTYNGNVRKPTVTVKDADGKTLVASKDYDVIYPDGMKLPGKYEVTVLFKGNYLGEKKLSFTIKPKATTGLKAKTQDTKTITLSWSKTTGATGYEVYKYNSSSKKYEKIASTTSTSYKVTKLTAGTAYKFKVRAYTKAGTNIFGAYSSVFSTATKTAKPTLKTATLSNGKVTLTWNNVSGESGYQIYYSTSKNGTYKKLSNTAVNKTALTTSKLISGKTYYFKVRAYKKVGDSIIYSNFSGVKSVKIK